MSSPVLTFRTTTEGPWGRASADAWKQAREYFGDVPFRLLGAHDVRETRVRWNGGEAIVIMTTDWEFGGQV